MSSHTNPYKLGPFVAVPEVYDGRVLVRLYATMDYGHGPDRTQRLQVAYFHSGDLREAIAALEGSLVEAAKLERKVDRVKARHDAKP